MKAKKIFITYGGGICYKTDEAINFAMRSIGFTQYASDQDEKGLRRQLCFEYSVRVEPPDGYFK